MNIGFIAHDQKKELMAAFCIAYKGILCQHSLYATGTTGSIIEEASGLQIHKFSPGSLGVQQIAARAAYNEMDLVIFFRDPVTAKVSEPSMESLLKYCDMNNIPFASNIATAEILIQGLQRGDLEFRNLLK
jgi:Methylglyoxal synthase